MHSLRKNLSLATAVLTASTSGLFAESDPLLTLDFKSYDRLIADAGAFAEAAGQDPAMIGMQVPMMLGPGLIELVDTSKPWHAAVWMESLEAKPVIAVVLPVDDFEGFETAIAASMLGQLGAQFFEVGESVVMFGSSPGAIVPDGWDALIKTYVADLKASPAHTVEVKLEMSDDMRAAAVASLALPKAQMMAAFDDPDTAAAAGMPPGAMKGMMESYFAFYESMLTETSRFEFAFGVEGSVFDFEMSLTPVEGSGLADFIASQDVDITDLAGSADWSSGMAMIAGMNDLPESWDPLVDSAMQSLMPLYGLDDSAAAEWTAAMEKTLPFKGAYSMNFEDGMSFFGFYDIMDTPAQEVYDIWLEITESVAPGGDSVEPYYSDIKIEKGVRTLNGHSVDRIELTLNPEHPSMQLPEQKQVMEQMFHEGKLAYEMALVDNRIYMATGDELERAFETKSKGAAPFEISKNTRLAATMNFAEIFKMGFGMSGQTIPPALAEANPEDVRLTYALETSHALTLRSSFPLSIITVFSEME